MSSPLIRETPGRARTRFRAEIMLREHLQLKAFCGRNSLGLRNLGQRSRCVDLLKRGRALDAWTLSFWSGHDIGLSKLVLLKVLYSKGRCRGATRSMRYLTSRHPIHLFTSKIGSRKSPCRPHFPADNAESKTAQSRTPHLSVRVTTVLDL